MVPKIDMKIFQEMDEISISFESGEFIQKLNLKNLDINIKENKQILVDNLDKFMIEV